MAADIQEKVNELMEGKESAERKKLSPIEEAKELMAKNEKLLAEIKEENDRADRRRADEMLAGKSQAGNYPSPKSKQELADEEAKSILRIYGKA